MVEKSHNNGGYDHFKLALVVISLAILIPSIAFISEKRDIAGLASSSLQYSSSGEPSLQELDNVKSLGTLVTGNYYIDDSGIVYWTDDSSSPPIAKVRSIQEKEKNRRIYVDDSGNVGYALS